MSTPFKMNGFSGFGNSPLNKKKKYKRTTTTGEGETKISKHEYDTKEGVSNIKSYEIYSPEPSQESKDKGDKSEAYYQKTKLRKGRGSKTTTIEGGKKTVVVRGKSGEIKRTRTKDVSEKVLGRKKKRVEKKSSKIKKKYYA